MLCYSDVSSVGRGIFCGSSSLYGADVLTAVHRGLFSPVGADFPFSASSQQEKGKAEKVSYYHNRRVFHFGRSDLHIARRLLAVPPLG